ncbi:2'-deoxycytidine 5'-triphosphate deaminase, partial [Candidatus Uhrbacteria bacterium]|nr:2'-deoxycytidine 5'-triphosphate deaminase [Candidatus Uhrbacteria bacterium]
MYAEHGAIPMQIIREMMGAGFILGSREEHLQPASIDLSLSDEAYRMRGSYLPRSGESISEIIQRGALYKHSWDKPLEVNATYLVRLNETLALPPGVHASASNKSSSGRINLRGRLVADGIPRFDDIPAGYKGGLWIELLPKSFPILAHPGDRINQMRFFHGDARLNSLEHRIAFDKYSLLRSQSGTRIPSTIDNCGRGITMTVDLESNEIVGWKVRDSVWNILDTHAFDHDPSDFFESVPKPKDGELVLKPGTFYILVTKEKILTPPNYATEMAAYDPSKGEFRSHFAGFFDPGWGWTDDEAQRGSVA